jgi:hypothetical protein
VRKSPAVLVAVCMPAFTWAGGTDVVVTKDPAAVSACTYLDVLHSWPPYILPGSDIRQLKKRAAEIGADTVLVVSRSVASEGKAYRCKPGATSAPTAAPAPSSSQ